MIQTASKAFFSSIAGSSSLKTLASRYGMRGPRSFARRFIAGETVEEAIAAARIIEASGLQQTLDLLTKFLVVHRSNLGGRDVGNSDQSLLDEVRRIYKGRVVLGHDLDVY